MVNIRISHRALGGSALHAQRNVTKYICFKNSCVFLKIFFNDNCIYLARVLKWYNGKASRKYNSLNISAFMLNKNVNWHFITYFASL